MAKNSEELQTYHFTVVSFGAFNSLGTALNLHLSKFHYKIARDK